MAVLKFVNSNYSDFICSTSTNVTGLNLEDAVTHQAISGQATTGTNAFQWLKANDSVEYYIVLSLITSNLTSNYKTHTTPEYYIKGGTNQNYIQFTFSARMTSQGYYQVLAGFFLHSNDYPQFTSYVYSTQTIVFTQYPTLSDYVDAFESGELGFYLWAYPGTQTDTDTVGLIAFGPSSLTDLNPNPYLVICKYNNASNEDNHSAVNSIFSPVPVTPDFGPDSEEDGGWGDFNDETENIELPDVPSISALSAGFVNMYNPSPAQLQVLVNALWSNDISQVFWKMFTDPMESLVSLQIFPVAPEVTPASVNIVMGNVTLQDQSTTPITFALAPALTNQYKIIDCGSLQMNEYWGSALDYSPYTKAEIFLPYIGVKEIDINDVMAATLHLQYIVDFLTGTCTAQLECVKAQHIDFSAPLYHWQGNMAMAVPASASDMSQLITSIASTLVSAGLTVATGGSGAAIASGIAGGALNMANAHPRIEKGGTVAMTAGALDNQTPFIILTRPIQSKPAGFENYKGWPSNITAELGSLSGYTEVEYVHVEVAGATDEERNEIERLLKEGVII